MDSATSSRMKINERVEPRDGPTSSYAQPMSGVHRILHYARKMKKETALEPAAFVADNWPSAMRTALLVSWTIMGMSGCGRTTPPAPVPANSAFFRRCTEPDLRPLIDKHMTAKKLALAKVSDTQGGIAEPGHLYSKKELEVELTGPETNVTALMTSLLEEFKQIAAQTSTAVDVRLVDFSENGRRWTLELNYDAGDVGGTVFVQAKASVDEKDADKKFRLVVRIEDMFPNRIGVVERSKRAPPRR